MDIIEKLKQVAETKDIDILAKHLVCMEAVDEIERLHLANGHLEIRYGNLLAKRVYESL